MLWKALIIRFVEATLLLGAVAGAAYWVAMLVLQWQ
jgi:hypothetical protein